jgi:sterol desaturase/sphingolipid hydroxylase (fatty acid hydroxylase superfamily)
MDWLATHRVHPVDQVMTNTFSLMPIFMCGFSATSVAIYLAVYQVHALLLHSNVRIRFGPLKWLIASPEYHHWHHANQREAYDRNFASQLAIIDVIAGTAFLPKRLPETYGLTEPMPELYHQQFLHPFRSLLRPWLRRFPMKGTPHEQDA